MKSAFALAWVYSLPMALLQSIVISTFFQLNRKSEMLAIEFRRKKL
jgi:hypothetical protein